MQVAAGGHFVPWIKLLQRTVPDYLAESGQTVLSALCSSSSPRLDYILSPLVNSTPFRRIHETTTQVKPAVVLAQELTELDG